jgi:hypothetical protein
LKDINIFSKALATKGVFRIISTEDLWQEVMRKEIHSSRQHMGID